MGFLLFMYTAIGSHLHEPVGEFDACHISVLFRTMPGWCRRHVMLGCFRGEHAAPEKIEFYHHRCSALHIIDRNHLER